MAEFPAGSVEIPYFASRDYEILELDAIYVYVAKTLVKNKSFLNLKEAIDFAARISFDDIKSVMDPLGVHISDMRPGVIRIMIKTAFLNKASGNIAPDVRLSALDTRMNNIDTALETHPKFEKLALEMLELRDELRVARVRIGELENDVRAPKSRCVEVDKDE